MRNTSLSTNFPVHVNEGKRSKLFGYEVMKTSYSGYEVDHNMHAGNLEDKGNISLLHEQ